MEQKTGQEILDHFGYLIFYCDGYRSIGEVVEHTGNGPVVPTGLNVVVSAIPSEHEITEYWRFQCGDEVPRPDLSGYHAYKVMLE